MPTKKTPTSRRTVLKGLAATGAATALPGLAQYAHAGSDEPIRIG
ncbi:MAG: twin-arginine translocation signal domain-containing protein, partial [Paracoccaceae bacterium]